MGIDQQFNDLALRFAAEFNTMRANELGPRVDLLTTEKTTLVKAINELFGIISGGLPQPGSVISDTTTTLATTWSSAKLAALFATAGGGGAQIDDNAMAPDKVWSSQKTAQAISAAGGGGAQIDDTVTTADKVWSSAHTSQIITAAVMSIPSEVNDTGTSTTTAWSSARTTAAIAAAIAGVPAYVLPDASFTVLGGIKIGTQFALDGGGHLVSNLTKGDLGLANVENKSSATIRSELTAQNVSDALGFPPGAGTVLIIKDEGSTLTGDAKSINFTGGNVTATVDGNGNVSVQVPTVTKVDLGLGNVENKSSSTIRGEITKGNVDGALGYSALDAAQVGVSVAQLVNGTVPAAQLPSYVDDIIEVATVAALPATGESGKLYIITTGADIDKQYRWSGAAYRLMVASPGTTDAVTEGATNLYFTESRVRATLLAGLSVVVSTAVTAGDSILSMAGKLQAQCTALGARITALTKADFGLGNVENKSSATIRGEITSQNVTDALTFTPGTGGPVIVKDEGTSITAAVKSINFVGGNVTATQSAGDVVVTITGSTVADTDALTEGTTNKYFTAARVLSTVVAGISFATATAVTAADTLLVALGKLQKQITDLTATAVTTGGVATLTNKTLTNATFTGFIETGLSPAAASVFAPDFALATDFEYITNANATLVLPNAAPGRTYTIAVTYGATGHSLTITGGGVASSTALDYSGGTPPPVTSLINKTDYYVCKCNRAGTRTRVFDGGRNF